MIASTLFFHLSPINGYKSSDPKGTLLVSQTILRHRTVTLDAYSKEFLEDYPWQIFQRNGRTFYSYPLGTSIYMLPLVATANIFHMDMRKSHHDINLQRNLAPITAALALLLIYLLARCFYPPTTSSLLTVVLGLGSSISSTMGIALYCLNLEVIFLLWSLLILVYARTGKKKLNPYLLGFLLFSAYFCRPTAAIIIGCFLVYLFWENKPAFFRASLAAFVPFSLLTLFSLTIYGAIYPGSYNFALAPEYSSFSLKSLHGVLLSPSRGILVFSPFLLVIIAGVGIYFRQLKGEALFWMALSGFIIHTLFVSSWKTWWGGGSYGPRLLLDGYPFLVLMTMLIFRHFLAIKKQILQRAVISLFFLLGIFSIYMNAYQGLFNPYTEKWNYILKQKGNEKILFDWSYPQFLANRDSLAKRNIRIGRQAFKGVYKLGEVVRPNSSNVYFSNWHAPQKNDKGLHRWSSYYNAEIWLYLKSSRTFNPEEKLVLKVWAGTYQKQSIEVLINGHLLGIIQSKGSSLKTHYRFPFNAFFIGKKQKNGLSHILLEFRIPNAVSPATVALESTDTRILGMSLFKLKIKAAPTIAPPPKK